MVRTFVFLSSLAVADTRRALFNPGEGSADFGVRIEHRGVSIIHVTGRRRGAREYRGAGSGLRERMTASSSIYGCFIHA